MSLGGGAAGMADYIGSPIIISIAIAENAARIGNSGPGFTMPDDAYGSFGYWVAQLVKGYASAGEVIAALGPDVGPPAVLQARAIAKQDGEQRLFDWLKRAKPKVEMPEIENGAWLGLDDF